MFVTQAWYKLNFTFFYVAMCTKNYDYNIYGIYLGQRFILVCLNVQCQQNLASYC